MQHTILSLPTLHDVSLVSLLTLCLDSVSSPYLILTLHLFPQDHSFLLILPPCTCFTLWLWKHSA